MNWYNRHQQVKIAQAVGSMQSAIQQVRQISDQIQRDFSEAKKGLMDQSLNLLFIRTESAARSVVNNLLGNNIPSAAQQIETAKQCLEQICVKINCMTTPVWQHIRQNFDKVWNIINSL